MSFCHDSIRRREGVVVIAYITLIIINPLIIVQSFKDLIIKQNTLKVLWTTMRTDIFFLDFLICFSIFFLMEKRRRMSVRVTSW